MNRKIFNDILLGVSILLFVIVLVLLSKIGVNGENLTAKVWYKNECLDTINLANQLSTKEKTYEFPEGTITIEYKNNAIRVLDSTCPNQICVREGWSDSPNKPIICMEMNFRIIIDSNFNQYDLVIG